MHDPEFIHEVIGALERLDISYFLVGSVCSSTWGEIRSTNNADIVVDATEEQIRKLVAHFEGEHYANMESALDALRRRSMFNIISNRSAMKVDLMISKQSPYALEQFRRRTQANICGMLVYLQSPEDTILSKLLWGRQSESEKQLRDVVGVLTVMRESLDNNYLDEWAATLGLTPELAKARTQSNEVETK